MTDTNLGDAYEFAKSLGAVDFSKLVRCTSEHKIIQYNPDNPSHALMLKNLTKALNNFVKYTRKATRFTGNRINDIGSALEETVTQEIRKVNLHSEKMGGSGYPDLLVTSGDLSAYVEIKSSGIKKKGTINHRMFFYTSGKKVERDALHLLLQIELSEERDRMWIVDSWTLRDLHDLKVRLKTEFNANHKDCKALGSLSQSDSEA